LASVFVFDQVQGPVRDFAPKLCFDLNQRRQTALCYQQLGRGDNFGILLKGLNVMPKYLAEGRYTSDGVKGLAHEGGSRRRADIAKTIEGAGGKLEAVYFAFGDADFFIIFDAPDNVSAAALSVAANQSGFVTSKKIVLITPDEMDQAIKKATTVEYLPPGH
jgi:uncharacterized protein with GYD domain